MSHNPDRTGIGVFQTEESEFLAHCLDLFTPPSTENSLLHGKTIEHNTINSINDSGPYEFLLPSHAYNEYTYLPLTRLEGEIKVKKSDNSVLAAADDVAPVNLFPNSLFRQIECELNGIQISDISSPTYPYKAYIETVLSYGKDAKGSHLQAGFFYDDAAGKQDVNAKSESNSFTKRNSFIAASKSLYFSTPLHIDFFHSERLLPPGCNLKVKLIRSSDNFSLIAKTGEYKIKIVDLKLYTRKIIVHDSIVSKHGKLFDKHNAIFPTPSSRIKTYVITSGLSAQTIPNIFRGKLPRQIIICMTNADGYNGDLTKNPFSFGHFNVNYIALKVNGSTIPSTVFQPNFSGGKYVREYRHFLDSCGIAHDDTSNHISLKEFGNGKTFFAYDLTPDMCNSYHRHAESTGYIDLDLQFSSPLSATVQVLVYGVFNTLIEINASRFPIIN